MKNKGEKDDGSGTAGGKLEFSLVPYDAFKEFVRVLMWGAYERPRPGGLRGYGANNWQYIPDARKRYYDALLRHVNVWYHGKERIDPDSGYHHLAHALCCAFFLLALSLRGEFALDEGETMVSIPVSLPEEMTTLPELDSIVVDVSMPPPPEPTTYEALADEPPMPPESEIEHAPELDEDDGSVPF